MDNVIVSQLQRGGTHKINGRTTTKLLSSCPHINVARPQNFITGSWAGKITQVNFTCNCCQEHLMYSYDDEVISYMYFFVIIVGRFFT